MVPKVLPMRRRHPAGTAPLDGLEKTHKFCSTCGNTKPMTTEFWPRDKNQPDGFGWRCKACKQAKQKEAYTTEKGRAVWLKRKFGITPEQYLKLLESVGGKCQVCGTDEGASKWDNAWTHLSIDHVHETGQIRGILCDRCNPGIGMFKDDPELLEKAAAYLRAYAAEHPQIEVDLSGVHVWRGPWTSPVTKREGKRWFTDVPELAHKVYPSKRAAWADAKLAISKRA